MSPCELRVRKSGPIWARDDPRRAGLIARRPATADAVATWAKEVHGQKSGRHGQSGQSESTQSTSSTQSTPTYPEIAANAALALIAVACGLLDRQLAAQASAFEKEGGFTERLYNRRQSIRRDR